MCKLNVFDSQFVRFSRIITDVGDFVDQVVKLINDTMQLGYSKRALLRRCRLRVQHTPFLFGVARGVSSSHPRGHITAGLYGQIKR